MYSKCLPEEKRGSHSRLCPDEKPIVERCGPAAIDFYSARDKMNYI